METQDRLLLRSVLSSIEELQKSQRDLWLKLDNVSTLATDVKLLNARLSVLKEFEESLDLLEREHLAGQVVTSNNKRWQYALASVMAFIVPVAIAWFVRVNSELKDYAVLTSKIQQQLVHLEERQRFSSLIIPPTKGEN